MLPAHAERLTEHARHGVCYLQHAEQFNEHHTDRACYLQHAERFTQHDTYRYGVYYLQHAEQFTERGRHGVCYLQDAEWLIECDTDRHVVHYLQHAEQFTECDRHGMCYLQHAEWLIERDRHGDLGEVLANVPVQQVPQTDIRSLRLGHWQGAAPSCRAKCLGQLFRHCQKNRTSHLLLEASLQERELMQILGKWMRIIFSV